MTILTLLVAAVAGCIDAPEEETCTGPDCPEDEVREEPPVPLPPRGTLDLPDSLYPRFEIRGCEEFTMMIDVPFEDLRARIPEEFRLSSFAPGVLGNILIHLLRCEEALDNETYFGPVHFFQALARVELSNDSWAGGVQLHRYVLHAASDNQAWNEAMLQTDLSFGYAEFVFEKFELPTGTFVALLQAEAADWDLSVEFSFITGDWQTLDTEYHWWYGDGPIHRMAYSEAFEGQATAAVGKLMHSGNTALAQVMPSPAMAHIQGSWRINSYALFQYDGAWNE
jgi:hypothetical protein